MAFLETTFLIDLLRGKSSVQQLKDELDRTERSLCVATPSIMELWSGALRAKNQEIEKEKIQELIQSLDIISFDEKSAKIAAEIEFELSHKGLPIQPEDILIASIAKANGEKLVTHDNHYTRISGLMVLKY